MKKVKLDKGKYYHRSLVSYMPSIVESGEIVPTSENVLQREERVWRYLSKRMVSEKKIRDVILKGNIDKYLRDVHKYVWVSSSRDYIDAKMNQADKTVFFDSDFVGREEGGGSVLYVFGKDGLEGCDFYSEGIVKHRRLIRGMRAAFKNINFVSKDSLRLSGVEKVLVGDNHLDKVVSLFEDNNLNIPVLGF